MKEVNLRRSAWHVKFFMWATGKPVKWNNLCPYFWSLVSLLLISPLLLAWKTVKTVVNGLIKIVKYIDSLFIKPTKDYVKSGNKTKGKKRKVKTTEQIIRKEKQIDAVKTVGKWIGYGFLGLYGLLAIFCVIMAFVGLFTKFGFLMGIVYIFAVIGALAFIILVIYLIGSYFQSDTHEMVVGMFRAKKQKYCPHINWK